MGGGGEGWHDLGAWGLGLRTEFRGLGLRALSRALRCGVQGLGFWVWGYRA